MSEFSGEVLYMLTSGRSLLLGLVSIAASLAGVRIRVLSSILAWSGVALVVTSAVPMHAAVYVLLVGSVLVWRLAARTRGRWVSAGAVMSLTILAVALALSLLRFQGPPASKGIPVVVIGDSLSAGLGSTQEGSWPFRLAATADVRVLNLAKPGATFATGPQQAGAIPVGPATVLVELGGNDLLGGSTTSQFANDLRRLLRSVVAENRRVFMFELPLLPFQNAYGSIQRQACHELGVVVIPRAVLAGAAVLPGHAIDGLHLSPEGHAWLARRVDAMLWGDDAG